MKNLKQSLSGTIDVVVATQRDVINAIRWFPTSTFILLIIVLISVVAIINIINILAITIQEKS